MSLQKKNLIQENRLISSYSMWRKETERQKKNDISLDKRCHFSLIWSSTALKWREKQKIIFFFLNHHQNVYMLSAVSFVTCFWIRLFFFRFHMTAPNDLNHKMKINRKKYFKGKYLEENYSHNDLGKWSVSKVISNSCKSFFCFVFVYLFIYWFCLPCSFMGAFDSSKYFFYFFFPVCFLLVQFYSFIVSKLKCESNVKTTKMVRWKAKKIKTKKKKIASHKFTISFVFFVLNFTIYFEISQHCCTFSTETSFQKKKTDFCWIFFFFLYLNARVYSIDDFLFICILNRIAWPRSDAASRHFRAAVVDQIQKTKNQQKRRKKKNKIQLST